MVRFLIVQIGFNAVWCACMIGAVWGIPWLGVSAALLWIALQLRRQSFPEREVALVLFAGVLGAIADIILIRTAGLTYSGAAPGALFGPLWIVALWMTFATSINASLYWLRGRPLVGALIGAAGGLLAYHAGLNLKVVSYWPGDPQALLALAAVWGVAIPLLVHLAHVCERMKPFPRRFERFGLSGILPSFARILR